MQASPHQGHHHGGGREARIAVIGAGIAGATAARRLADQGHRLVIFDKGRDAGGRMATRRSRSAPSGRTFDHGAQYFTARDPDFRRQTADWVSSGVCAPWQAMIAKRTGQTLRPVGDEERFVGRPGMTAIARHLLSDLDFRPGFAVTSIAKQANGWTIDIENGHGQPASGSRFDAVVIAVPAHQAARLLAPSTDLANAARTAEMAPCWTVMTSLPDAALPGLDGQPVAGLMIEDDACLAWIADNSSKPDRNASADGMNNWVVQASPAWSRQHLEDDAATVQSALLSAAAPILGISRRIAQDPPFAAAHRWRFAKVTAPAGEACLFDPALGLGACGDWCLGPRVEAAYLSGRAVAGRVNDWLATADDV